MNDAFHSWLHESEIKAKFSRPKLIKDLRDAGLVTRQRREDDRKRLYYGVTLSHVFYKEYSAEKSRDGNTGQRLKKTGDSVTLDRYDEKDEDGWYEGSGPI
jgi:hypothetical protein